MAVRPISRARGFFSRPRLGRTRPYQRRSDGTVGSWRRDCWWPVRLAWVWSRGQQWRPWVKRRDGTRHQFAGRFGWECTSAVLGDFKDLPAKTKRDLYTGDARRPHIFGQTFMLGPLRIITGPRTGWADMPKAQLLAKLREVDGASSILAEQRDQLLERVRELEDECVGWRRQVEQLTPKPMPDGDVLIGYIPSRHN